MKTLFGYILLAIAAFTLASCSKDEGSHLGWDDEVCVEYVAQMSGFSAYNVSSDKTKLPPSPALPSDLDKKIVSAYFMVYGNDGKRIEMRTATVTDNKIEPEVLYHNSGKGPLTICYLVNVTESYANSLDDISKFSNPDYAYEFSYAVPSSADGHIGVPDLNGTPCFPMIGMLTQSYEDNQLSGVVKENGNYKSNISLKRLFAKVYVQVKWDRTTSVSTLLGDQGFVLNSYKISNLPKKVLLAENNNESSWVKNADAFSAPVEVASNQETGLLTGDALEFTFYVPEYKLTSNGTTDDQKQKPTLFDPQKYPVCLTMDGIVKSTDFVTVQAKYSIYLGEDALDSFSLIRNNQYNNIITITGTGDAILGTDKRVETTYHNLADPTNSGKDNPANCYIIGRPGRYLIPTYKGNSTAMLGGIDASKTTIHSDGANSITNITYIPDVDGKNWVMFDVNMTITDNAITALPKITNGNTVLEFKNSSGTTVWSWHLWFTEGGFMGGEWGSISSETYQITNAVMMDRNLGSSGAGNADGVYYQWGDKDPYIAGAYKGGVAAGSWSGSAKTVTDPCPPGYKVPSISVWLTEESWRTTTAGKDQPGGSFIYDFREPNVLYPFSNYILEDGTKNTNNEVEVEYNKPEFEFTGIGLGSGSIKINVLISLPVIAQDKFTDLDMTIKVTENEGSVWYCNNTSEENKGCWNYAYTNLNISSLNIEAFRELVTIKSYKHQRRVATGYTTKGLSMNMLKELAKGNVEELSKLAEWGEYKDINPGAMSDTDKGSLLAKLYDEKDVINKTEYNITPISGSPKEGYQVRCVKETSTVK